MIAKEAFMTEINKIRKEIDEKNQNLTKEIKLMQKEMAEMKVAMRDQQRSIGFMSDSYDDIKRQNECIRKEMVELKKINLQLSSENSKLKQDVVKERNDRAEQQERLELLINPVELERRACNLELCGCPELEKDDCMSNVIQLLREVVPERIDIKNAFRIGKKRDGQNNRPILIQFNTKMLRDKVYKNRSNLKKFSDGGNPRFFLNENLPPNLKTLLGKANSLRKQKHFKFLWTNNGVILVKKDENSITIPIKKISDLDNIV